MTITIDHPNSSWDQLLNTATTKKSPSLFQKITGIFHTPKVEVDAVRQAVDAFREHFGQCLEQIAPSDTSPEQIQATFATIEDSLKLVTAGDDSVSEDDWYDALQHVDRMARAALSIVKMRAAPSTPEGLIEVFARPGGGFNVVRKVGKADCVVLEGGGTKGAVYGVALTAMGMAGQLPASLYVGTSAGAITSVYLASGVDPSALSRLATDMPMKDYLGTAPDFADRYPHVTLREQLIGYRAGDAIRIIDELTSGSVQRHLQRHWHEPRFQAKLQELTGPQQHRLAQLRDQRMDVSREGLMLTFADLAMLHTLAPETFGRLSVTAWNRDTGSTAYFDAEKTPQVEVALAVRASMSIPGFFWPIELTVDGQTAIYTDGGQGSNLPIEFALERPCPSDRARTHTVALKFDRDGSAHRDLHLPPSGRQRPSKLLQWVMGDGYVKSCEEDAQKTHDHSSGLLVVHHDGIGTLDFSADPRMLRQAQAEAWKSSARHLVNTRGQAYTTECETPEACYDLLTLSEKRWLLDGSSEEATPSRHLSRSDLLARHFLRSLKVLARADETLALPVETTTVVTELADVNPEDGIDTNTDIETEVETPIQRVLSTPTQGSPLIRKLPSRRSP